MALIDQPDPRIAPPLTPAARPRRRFASWRVILALILREMSTRYGRSPGGYVWAVLEPLGAILVMALGFSILLRAPSLGNSFILFYASGFLPFILFQNVQLSVTRSLLFSKPLLQYPAVTWVDAIVARFLLNLLTSLMVAYLLIYGILLFADTRAVISIGPMLEAFALAALFALGVGVMNCLLIGLFRVWESIWSIFTRPLFLVSGVFFLYEDMPRWIQDILWYNPLLHITAIMRTGIYPTYNPEYVSVVFVLVTSLTPLLLGLILLSRYHRDILND